MHSGPKLVAAAAIFTEEVESCENLFFWQHFTVTEHYTNRRAEVELERTQALNEVNTDSEVKERSQTDDCSSGAGFLEVFGSERGRLKRIAVGMGLNGADADDVLQDVSIKALKGCAEYRTREDALRWLMKVTVNLCFEEHRRQKRFGRAADEVLKRRLEKRETPNDTDKVAIAAEELEIVRKTMRELDETLLGPLALRYFCGLNSTEVGEILNLSPSTVRGRLRDGRMVLARRLIERGVER